MTLLGTPAGTVANRTQNIRAAAAMLALAYLRLIVEGESVRASVVLFEFQRFYTENRRDIIPNPPPFDGVPPDLSGSGYIDRPTHNALVFILWLNSLIPNNVAEIATADWGVPILIQQVWPTVQTTGDHIWGAYRAALSGPAQDAGMNAYTWVFGFIEGLHTQTPEPSPPIIPADEGFAPTGDGVYEFETPILIPGLVRKSSGPALWPWALAAGAGVLLLGGFLYKRRGRRSR